MTYDQQLYRRLKSPEIIWTTTANGNACAHYRGQTATVFRLRGRDEYTYVISRRDSGGGLFTKERYDDICSAQMAAEDDLR